MTPSSYKPQEPRYSDLEQCHTVLNHEGSRNYPPQGPTPREMLHYTNRRSCWRWRLVNTSGGRWCNASQPDCCAARQRLLPPSDGDEGGLRRHAAERRRAPHPQLQRALEGVEGRGTIALQGEARKQVVVPDVLYVSGVHANLMSAGQLKENSVKLQDESGEMLLVSSAGDVLGRARFSGRILCSDLRPCSTMSSTEVVALRTIAPATKLTPDMLHLRLVHVGVDTIKSSAKHEVAAGLDIKKSTAADLPSASCVSGKLARHTFPDQVSDAKNALDVVHIDLCGPF
ncbi:unnamed protein product [Closterium sp. NIES-53]